jgi:hypothetical protein
MTNDIKIYIICLDAFPETEKLKEKLKELQRVDLVCAGAFTTSTMTSMISGTVGSDIIPGGIGSNTSYSKKFLEWREKGGCLPDIIRSNNYDFVVHNHIPWMSSNIIGKPLSNEQIDKHYRDHVVDDMSVTEIYDFGVICRPEKNLIYSSCNPSITLNTFIGWGDISGRTAFYNNEEKYFTYIRDKFNGVLFTDICHWHEAVYYPSGNPYLPVNPKHSYIELDIALNCTVNWLDCFDFNQENSVYFIYADHSHRVEPYLDTPAYITWAYWKDNRKHPQKLHPVMSSYDVYPLVLSLLDIPISHQRLSRNPLDHSLYNSNRIYYTEDGRSSATIKDCATVFTRTILLNNEWIAVSHVIDGASISPGYYVCISPCDNKYAYHLYHINMGTCTNLLSPDVFGPNKYVKCAKKLSDRYIDVVVKLGVPPELINLT